MIQPKELYRKLSALLANIDAGRTTKDFLFSVSAKLENSFAEDLYIQNGRLYAEEHEAFVLLNSPRAPTGVSRHEPVRLDAEAAKLVLKNGSYIYNEAAWRISKALALTNENLVPAAFTVRNTSQRWIFVFELKSGWVREEVEFCLNAVRTLLNFRLVSDALTNDVERAALIQRSLLPSHAPHIVGYETAGRSEPAEVVGGDFFDFSIFDEEVFSVAVGDASGHGLPAALLVRDVVTGLRMGVEKEMNMAEAMQKLNRVIHRSTLSTHFISLFYGEIASTGEIVYVNAGHPPPLLVHGDEIHTLRATGTILGALPEITLHRASARFKSGAVLLVYSDGLLERSNQEDEEFGVLRLQKLLLAHQHKSASDIVDIIYETSFGFGNRGNWQDDVTIVVVKKLQE